MTKKKEDQGLLGMMAEDVDSAFDFARGRKPRKKRGRAR